MEEKISIDIVAAEFHNLVQNDYWMASMFIEENLKEKWLEGLLTLNHKSDSFAVEAAFIKGQVSAITKINQERNNALLLHEDNLKRQEDKEKKLSGESNEFRSGFVGPNGMDRGRKGIKSKFLRGLEKIKK